MSPYAKLMVLMEWVRLWIRFQLLPTLNFSYQHLLIGTLRGTFDTLLLFLLGTGLLVGGSYYMDSQYTLPRYTQETVLKWAPIADNIARHTDIPREVPLVLWFKENSMLAENPDNCTGIMGAYDLVRSGERPCFTPGPVSDFEVTEQLTIGAMEFKKRCPDITYMTQDPETVKRCYFAYNAGMGAASRLDVNESAYVMNGYDEAFENMVYSDVELGTVRVTQLGAWPTHLAMQSLIISQFDEDEFQRPFTITAFDLSSRMYDWVEYQVSALFGLSVGSSQSSLVFSNQRDLSSQSCLATPHRIGLPGLRPSLNPVTESPILTQDVHGCSYNLPGLDISSNNSKAILQAPMPGELTTFTDRWFNSTIRIENDEWIVWLLHPRSYLIKEGTVKRGQAIGVMGAIGNATGPHVHYTVYDKSNDTFVDPSLFVP